MILLKSFNLMILLWEDYGCKGRKQERTTKFEQMLMLLNTIRYRYSHLCTC